MSRRFPMRRIGVALFAALLPASVALAQPHGGGERRGEGGGHGGGVPHGEMHRGGGGFHEGGFAGHGFAGHDPGRLHGNEGGFRHYDGSFARGGFARAGFVHERFGEADWVRGGWHGSGPYLAYAGGRDSWDWRGAWDVGFWGPELSLSWGGWAWGGIAVGAGIGLIVAPPVYVLPPPIYVSPPPIVLGLPAIAPPPLMEPPPPAVASVPTTGDLVAAAVPPPIVVSPPPYVVADAGPPPVVFAPSRFAFAIAPPVLAFSVIGPAFYSGGYFTGGFVTSRYYGAVWDRPYWHTAVRYERPGFFGRVGASIGLGTAFGGGHYRYERSYGRNDGGWSHGDRGFHEQRGGGGGHRGRERG